MTKLEQIEKSIAELPQQDVAKLKQWLEEFYADMWDRQIEADIKAGKLDKLAEQAREDIKAGRFRDIMKHIATRALWRHYDRLTADVRSTADKNFELLKTDPRHPSLRLEKVG